MPVLFLSCFFASIVFFVAQTLRADILFAVLGLYLSLSFLRVLRGSGGAISINENKTRRGQRLRTTMIRGLKEAGLSHSNADIAFTLLVTQMFAQVRIYLFAAILIAGGGYILRRFNEVVTYIIAFGILASTMFVITIICILRHSPSKPP